MTASSCAGAIAIWNAKPSRYSFRGQWLFSWTIVPQNQSSLNRRTCRHVLHVRLTRLCLSAPFAGIQFYRGIRDKAPEYALNHRYPVGIQFQAFRSSQVFYFLSLSWSVPEVSGVSVQVSGFRHLRSRTPETWHLKPETNELRYCCPAGATFSCRSLWKSLASFTYRISAFFYFTFTLNSLPIWAIWPWSAKLK